ncbi:MAG TPA: HD domain-containing phosphohydrolase [Gaiellaceae bacterium]|nr:HD domain-containing phosphohydrolase [Gaiellaceae bacterium]
MRLLLVDDDPGFRALVRATFDDVDVDIAEAGSAAEARAAIRDRVPDVVLLDVLMPGESGVDLCRDLKSNRATDSIRVVLLTGSPELAPRLVADAGADAFVTKPFSPLQLLGVVERLAGGVRPIPLVEAPASSADNAQLLLYARDLRQLFELERAQRRVVQEAYRQTVGALAEALASKDAGTSVHSHRVLQYALELALTVQPTLLEDPSIEYGFLLHDVGKIGIPDRILLKPGPLDADERRMMQLHTVLGEQMLGGVVFLQGDGLAIIRSHHERWDGGGYPDGLHREEIPLPARIFAVADTLDAMTNDRPYRRALPWGAAVAEIVAQSGAQFDPTVVDAFVRRQPALRQIRHAAAA